MNKQTSHQGFKDIFKNIEILKKSGKRGNVMGELQLVQLDNGRRITVLKKLGYSLNENGYIVDNQTKKEIICKYSKEHVHISNAAILPGSVIIINATPENMAQYFLDIED
jgi:hypothetical protein